MLKRIDVTIKEIDQILKSTGWSKDTILLDTNSEIYGTAEEFAAINFFGIDLSNLIVAKNQLIIIE